MNVSKRRLITATALTTTLMFVSAAHAGGFALREQSAYGQGSSFAGIAAGGSLSSMFWNPATLGQVEGIQTESVHTGVFADSEVETAFGDEGNIGGWAYVPSGYAAARLTDRLVVGVGINGPFGLTTKYDLTSPLRSLGAAGTSEAFSLNVNPNIAFQLNEYVTIAAGLQAQYLQVRYTDFLYGTTTASLEGDDISFGATAGIQIMVSPNTEIGLGFRSATFNTLDGELSIAGGAAAGTYNVEAELNTPETVTLGIRHRFNERWTGLAGVEWANWSRLDKVPVAVDENGFGASLDFELPFDYEDSWYFSAGAEFHLNEQTTLRGGIGYELSPIGDEARTLRLPDDDRLWLSLGGSYELDERYSFDVGYSYIHVFDGDVGGALPADVETDIHIISTAFKMKLGSGALFAGNHYE